MSDPRRSDPAAAAADLSDRDRDARVEELLLSGLDHYFHGRHDLAINIWTRVLFLDRGHARARAYIERARSAEAERHREGEELVHAGAAALAEGDADGARRLLTSALERGAASDDTLAMLDRLQRLEAAGLQQPAPPRRSQAMLAPRAQPREPHGRAPARLGWIAAGALLGMAAALSLMVWAGGDAWFAPPPVEGVGATAPRAEDPLPVPTLAEVALMRARVMFEKGRLREALPALEAIRPGDPLRPQADDLKATIQRRLLETRPREATPPGAPVPDGAAPGGSR
jgi:tetratricopeptide (TPR) repeat protein